MKAPSLKCVDLIHEQLKLIVKKCGERTQLEMQRFPRVFERMNEIVSGLLSSRITPTKEFVANVVNVQRAFINTKHPEFADKSLEDYAKEQEAKAAASPFSTPISNMIKKIKSISLNSEDIDERVRESRFRDLTPREQKEADLVG